MTVDSGTEALPDLTQWIRPGDTVMWGQAGAQPTLLTRALIKHRHALGRIRLFLGSSLSAQPGLDHADAFDFVSYCGGGTNRTLAAAGVLDILPCHYSDLPHLIRTGALRVDVLMLQVSAPDDGGIHSLGQANEYLVPALDAARTVIAEANPLVPWTYGERNLTAADFSLVVSSSDPLSDSAVLTIGPIEQAIGNHVASLIEDGSTLQLGIGAIPDSVLSSLDRHRDLGIHSGAIGDGVAALSESGVITNARKTIDPGVSVAGVLMGGTRLRKFAHRNSSLRLRSTDYTHNHAVLSEIDRFVTINSAIEVDLTGQVNAEVAGGCYVGAVGGALDFARAAHRSPGGKVIFALRSTAGARSRIVAKLSGPVSTPRSDVGFVVTEHGVADLRGQPLSERVRRMLLVADPAHRDSLEKIALSARLGQQ